LRKVVSATRQVSTVTEVSSSWPSRGQVTLSFDPSGAGGLLVSVADSAEVLRLPLDSLQLTNVAGVRDASGTTDGSRDVARLGRPVAAVAFGQTLIIVDGRTGTIRRADLLSGAIDTIAGSVSNNGSENGIGDGARFDRPGKIAGDGGDNLFLLDDNNQKLRRISLRTGQVSTLSDLAVGPAAPTLSLEPVARPLGLAFIAPDRLYVSHSNGWLGRVDPGSGSLRILLGPADVPSQLTWDPTVLAPESDGKLLIGDGLWNRLYRYDEATGKATSVSYIYDGHQVIDPTAMVLDGRGTAYVADGGMDVVVRVDVASGQWMVLAGQRGTSGFVDGPGFDARFNNPHDLIFDGPDHLLVADTMNGAIRRVSITSGEVTTWIGAPGRQGVKVGALPAGLNQPRGLYALPDGGVVITDGAENVVLTAR
jgi:sugar lactone lactonase YvrE